MQLGVSDPVINGRRIGTGAPVYIIAEMSANHGQNLEQALRIIKAAKHAGADAVKIQTYTPDTITINADNDFFRIKGTLWHGRTLYHLYGEAYTPWDWHPQLAAAAADLGLDFFSTPFDASAVEFLERMEVPAYKIASFELIDLPLLRKVAGTGKPVIMSTGMATIAEIAEAVESLRAAGNKQLALLKCTSAYPAPPEEMHLATIPHLAQTFGCPVGVSDHTLGIAVPVAAVSLGGCIVEKHLALDRDAGGPDSAFSLEPTEFAEMVRAIRDAEKAIGKVSYELSGKESETRRFRRSLFVVKDIRKNQVITEENVRSIRPGDGLHPRFLTTVLGRRATCDIQAGMPLSWEMVGNKAQG